MNNNTEILREYTAARKEIRSLCNLLLNTNQGKYTMEPTWGDVGVMNHVINVLKDLTDFLNGTGEYAE